MAVHVDIGGQGSIFPPRGTQLPDFVEFFRRPIDSNLPPKDGDSWGSRWAVHWLMNSISGEFEEFEEAARDRDPLGTLNPVIRNSRGVFLPNRFDISAATAAWPFQLAWLSEGFRSQYVEGRMPALPLPANENWELFLMCVFSANPGTREYNPGINFQSGFFALTFRPAQFDPGNPNLTGSRLCFYKMPTNPLPGIVGASLDVSQVWSIDLIDAPLSATKRLEAEILPNGNWFLRAYIDGALQTQTQRPQELGDGLPGVMCMLLGNDRSSPHVPISYFKAGRL